MTLDKITSCKNIDIFMSYFSEFSEARLTWENWLKGKYEFSEFYSLYEKLTEKENNHAILLYQVLILNYWWCAFHMHEKYRQIVSMNRTDNHLCWQMIEEDRIFKSLFTIWVLAWEFFCLLKRTEHLLRKVIELFHCRAKIENKWHSQALCMKEAKSRHFESIWKDVLK